SLSVVFFIRVDLLYLHSFPTRRCSDLYPSSGAIFLDGVDLREYDTKFLRDNIGLVLQKNHIFKGSIADNIRYGKISASLEEVVEDRKSTRLNSSHVKISYAVFCLKKKQ